MGIVSPAHDQALALLADRVADFRGKASGWHRIASPILVEEDEFAKDVAGIQRLCVLVDMLPELAFGGDRSAFARFHGIPREFTDLLTGEIKPKTWYARPDCVLNNGHLRVLEFNIGTGTVDLTAAVASNFYFAGGTPLIAVRAMLAGQWDLAEWTADEALAAALDEFGGGRPVGMWYEDSSAGGVQFAKDICDVVSMYGTEAFPVHTADVQTVDGPLFACFSTVHLLGVHGGAVASAFRWAAGRPDRVLARPSDVLRTAKANLALLHDLAVKGILDGPDAELVRRHIPETMLAGRARTDARVRQDKDVWVIKPNISFRGLNVLFGRGMSNRDWQTALDEMPAGVVQKVVEPDSVPLLEYRDGAPRVERGGRVVIMPHFIAGSFADASVRFSTDSDVLGRIDFRSVYSTLCLRVRRRVPEDQVRGGIDTRSATRQRNEASPAPG